MEIAEVYQKVELHRQGIRQLDTDDLDEIVRLVRAGLMLYGFVMARSNGKNIPCEAWEAATKKGGVVRDQHLGAARDVV